MRVWGASRPQYDLRRSCPSLVRQLRTLPQEHDAIGVGALVVVVDSPAVGGLGEFLGVDEDEFWVET